MALFYLILVIFSLDRPMAQRFRLRFVRPAVRSKLEPSLKAIIDRAWQDGDATLDLRLAIDQKIGLSLLAKALKRLIWEYPGSSNFLTMSIEIRKLAEATVVDRIGWLDDEFVPKTFQIIDLDDRPRRKK